MQCFATMAIDEPMDASDELVDITENFNQPPFRDACDICKMEIPRDAINAQGEAFTKKINVIRCSWSSCRHGLAHLECVPNDLAKITCHVCRYVTLLRREELSKVVQGVRTGSIESISILDQQMAFNTLELMDDDYIAMVLALYYMSYEELKSLESIIAGTGKDYPKVIMRIRCLALAYDLHYMRPHELLEVISNPQSLAAVLPDLYAVITPYFIKNINSEQIITLISQIAAQRTANITLRNNLIEKIAYLTDMLSENIFYRADIQNLILRLIASNSCDVLKCLIGKVKFVHSLLEFEIFKLVDRYARSGYEYSDATFVPLLVYLMNEYKHPKGFKVCMEQAWKEICKMGHGSDLPVCKKLQSISKSCSSAASIEDVVETHMGMLSDTEFCVHEDLFCAINIYDPADSLGVLANLVENGQDVAAAHFFRYFPVKWITSSSEIYADLAVEAIEAESLVFFEEIFVRLMLIKYRCNYLRKIAESLLKSNYQDYVGLLLKINSLRYIGFGKGITNWLFSQLDKRSIIWCIPYLNITELDKNSKAKTMETLEDSLEIMKATMASGPYFSPLLHEVVKYDLGCEFFTKHLLEYLEALLGASTSKYIFQRLLVNILSNEALWRFIGAEDMAKVHEILERQPDFSFYLNAFYNALQYHSQRNYLKELIIGDLEKNASPWVVVNNVKAGRLHERKQHVKCNDCGEFCFRQDFEGCEYCTLTHKIPLEDLLTALCHCKAVN